MCSVQLVGGFFPTEEFLRTQAPPKLWLHKPYQLLSNQAGEETGDEIDNSCLITLITHITSAHIPLVRTRSLYNQMQGAMEIVVSAWATVSLW